MSEVLVPMDGGITIGVITEIFDKMRACQRYGYKSCDKLSYFLRHPHSFEAHMTYESLFHTQQYNPHQHTNNFVNIIPQEPYSTSC